MPTPISAGFALLFPFHWRPSQAAASHALPLMAPPLTPPALITKHTHSHILHLVFWCIYQSQLTEKAHAHTYITGQINETLIAGFSPSSVVADLVEANCLVETTGPNGVKQTQCSNAINISSVFTQLKRTLKKTEKNFHSKTINLSIQLECLVTG